MKLTTLTLVLTVCLLSIFQKTNAQYCVPILGEDIDFHVTPRFVNVEADWYPGWD
jgi:hypothetical protein